MTRIDRELIEAAGANNLPEVRQLLRAEADGNAMTETGYTSLIGA
jgi:hypothetical protein